MILRRSSQAALAIRIVVGDRNTNYLDADSDSNYQDGLAVSYPPEPCLSKLLHLDWALTTNPWIFGYSIDKLVIVGDDGISGTDVAKGTLALLAVALLGVSLARGFSDFVRTYCTESLSQKVSYDFRNGIYDKLQHLSFAYHDKEHTGNLMSKATSDVEAIRRFVNMGLVRSLEVFIRVVAITAILAYLNWELALISLVLCLS